MSQKLLDAIEEASEIIKNSDGLVSILTHYDADGLSSGGSLLRLLYKNGKNAIIRSTQDLDVDTLESFLGIEADLHVISDMGSGDLELIRSEVRKWNVKRLIIIDHHKIADYDLDDRITLVNPELYGVDGGEANCTGVLTAYLGYLSTNDPYFYIPGLIGASGDMQIQEPKELTKRLLDDALRIGLVKKMRDFIFFSNKFLPVHKAITWTFYPYISGFSGRDDIGLQLVRAAGIEIKREDGTFKTVNDLDDIEKNALLERIVEYLASLGLEDLKPRDLMREYYILVDEDDHLLRHLDDFTNIVNATGRMGYEHLGILLSAGAREEIVEEAKRIYMERRRKLAEYLSKAEKKIKVFGERVLVIDLTDEEVNPRFSGTISTLYSKSLTYSDKVVYVLTRTDRGVKISARSPLKDAEKGLNLADIMRGLANKFGGRGGGHKMAAGATIHGDISSIIQDLVENTLSMLRD